MTRWGKRLARLVVLVLLVLFAYGATRALVARRIASIARDHGVLVEYAQLTVTPRAVTLHDVTVRPRDPADGRVVVRAPAVTIHLSGLSPSSITTERAMVVARGDGAALLAAPRTELAVDIRESAVVWTSDEAVLVLPRVDLQLGPRTSHVRAEGGAFATSLLTVRDVRLDVAHDDTHRATIDGAVVGTRALSPAAGVALIVDGPLRASWRAISNGGTFDIEEGELAATINGKRRTATLDGVVSESGVDLRIRTERARCDELAPVDALPFIDVNGTVAIDARLHGDGEAFRLDHEILGGCGVELGIGGGPR